MELNLKEKCEKAKNYINEHKWQIVLIVCGICYYEGRERGKNAALNILYEDARDSGGESVRFYTHNKKPDKRMAIATRILSQD